MSGKLILIELAEQRGIQPLPLLVGCLQTRIASPYHNHGAERESQTRRGYYRKPHLYPYGSVVREKNLNPQTAGRSEN
jgi:hypothetical protein